MTREERRAYFAEHFKTLYEERWLANGNSDIDFVRELASVSGRHTSWDNLARWIHGESTPEVYLSSIAEVLECEISDLIGENIETVKHYTGEKKPKKRASEMTVIEYRGAVLNEMCKAVDKLKRGKSVSADFIEGMRETMKVMYDYDFNELEPETPSWVERNNRKCI